MSAMKMKSSIPKITYILQLDVFSKYLCILLRLLSPRLVSPWTRLFIELRFQLSWSIMSPSCLTSCFIYLVSYIIQPKHCYFFYCNYLYLQSASSSSSPARLSILFNYIQSERHLNQSLTFLLHFLMLLLALLLALTGLFLCLLLHLLFLLLLLEEFLFLLLEGLLLQLRLQSLFKKLTKRRFVEPPLDPHSIHLESSFPILQQFTVEVDLDGEQSRLPAKLLQFLLKEVVHAHAVILTVKIVLQLAVPLARQVELAEVIPAVVSEEEEASRFHGCANFLHDLLVSFGSDGREDENERIEVSSEWIRYLIFDQIAHANLHTRFELLMLLHFLLDERDGLFGDIAAVVIEALKLPQKREKSVPHSAAKFIVAADCPRQLVQVFEVCDFWHFAFEIGPVLEEVALVELVELVPDLVAACSQPPVVLLSDKSVVLCERAHCFLLHLLSELVENDHLLWPASLVQLHLPPDVLLFGLALHVGDTKENILHMPYRHFHATYATINHL